MAIDALRPVPGDGPHHRAGDGGQQGAENDADGGIRGDEFFVFIDIPGIDEDDVELTVERNVVSIRARRVSPRQEGDEVLVDERPHGVFARQLFLGDNLDAGKLSADYNRGVLMMRIPIAEASKPRRITVSHHDDAAPDNGSARAEQAADQQPAATTS